MTLNHHKETNFIGHLLKCKFVQNVLLRTSNRPTAIDMATPVDLRGLFPWDTGQGSL